jgi:5-methylcytosine-specific restriction endonuclease McrA
MRFEIVLFLITGFIMANIYTDGKYLKQLWNYKKYYQMAGVAFGALVLYWLIQKNPSKAREMISNSNEYLKYLPVDQGTTSMLAPILDFTAKQSFNQEHRNQGYSGGTNNPILGLSSPSETRILNSGLTGSDGTKATKRSVSETKKKFIASRQNWKCGDCGEQLNAWFEVDHKIRLEYGGSNHVDNLVALCRECHGKKTTMENL